MSTEVSTVWTRHWQEKPAFVPVDTGHDSISILTRVVVKRLPDDSVTFVDIGSGPGSRTIPIVGGRESLELILLDQSSDALRLAQDHAQDQSVRANYVQADGFRLPLSDSSIGCVFANGLNEHFLDPLRQALINEMVRVSKQDGFVAIIVPNKLNPFHTGNKTLQELRGRWTHGPQYDFTPHELQKRMQLAGLREVELYGVGAFTSWIRLLPRDKQDPFHKSPTPLKLLNQALWSLDANTNSIFNRKFGREILGIGIKP
ncbi:class I SAM-dependent methyltransferase [Patescibacteria group bacterium]|nr:class I SAM-dependent methyltransferase [Patescibacteria group bacterium]